MATVIRLQRGGRKKRPFYSIVVMDKRNRRDGAFIEKLGYFDPCRQPEVIKIDRERAEHWLSQGAQASARVMRLLAVTAEGSAAATKAARKAEREQAKKAEAEAKAKAEAEAKAKAEAEAEAETKAEAAEAATEAEAPAEEAAAEEGEAGKEGGEKAGA